MQDYLELLGVVKSFEHSIYLSKAKKPGFFYVKKPSFGIQDSRNFTNFWQIGARSPEKLQLGFLGFRWMLLTPKPS